MGNKFKVKSDATCVEAVIYGKNMKEVFENSAFGMYASIGKPDKESKRVSMKITSTANNTEDLLMSFLRDLLHYYLVRKILIRGITVMSLTENKVHAKLTGEELSRRHVIKNDIKSVKFGAADGAAKIVETRTGYRTSLIYCL